MNVYLDDEKVDVVFDPNEPLAAGLRRVQQACCRPGRLIVGVKRDGVPLINDDLRDALSQPLTDCRTLELTSTPPRELVMSALEEASGVLAQVDGDRDHAAELFAGGREAEGMRNLSDTLVAWRQIHDAIIKSIGMLGIDPQTILVKGEPLERALESPRQHLQQVRDALEAQDFILLADILQYEFPEVVQKWKELIETIQDLARQDAAPP